MIFEYALEPELVASWYERRTARYFREQFRIGSPRVVSKFPASWKKQIWAAFKELNIEDDNAERKLEALIQAISENLAGRPEHEWQDGLSWIENAISEHNRAPFRGILAKQRSKICAEIITENCVDADHPIWNVPSDAVVQRTPNGLAEAVGPLLGMATKIVFVDYMLGMEKPRYRRAMAAYLNKVVTNRANGAIDQVEIITSAGGTAEFFEQTVRAELPRLIPAGLKVRVWKITPSHGGAALHNRYILTNRGGLKFGWGLDSGRSEDDDDVSILGKDSFMARWQRYTNVKSNFVVVVGPLDIPSSRV